MRKGLLGLLLVLFVMGCGSGSKKSETDNNTPAPGKAVLVFPAQNEACNNGVAVSDSESAVTFNWNTSDNTQAYNLVIKNLLTNTSTTQTTTNNQLQVTLLRNTPYSWYVVSKSSASSKTAQSDTWKFYNAGLGVVTYAPFPAEIVSPAYGQAVNATGGTVNLTWKGTSVDQNIIGYGVYFGTTTNPPVLQNNVKDSFLNNVTVLANTTYYWRVVTIDANGNYSDSGLYQFKVN